MEISEIVTILEKSSKYEDFLNQNPDYDIIIREVPEEDQERIQKEYPSLDLFPHSQEHIISVTLISRVLMQNGYPKLKAYINWKKKRYIHVFGSD